MATVNVSHVVRLYTLLLLHNGPKHGYEIMKEIERVTGSEPTPSHIYPFLSDLEEQGLVESRKTGSRGKKVYDLTDEGDEFAKKQISSFGEILDASIAGSVEECTHCDCEIYDGGVVVDDKTYCCKHCARADGANTA